MRERLPAIIGYARVSTEEQHLDLQLAALRAAGCAQLFQDEGVSAIAKCRPGFQSALAVLHPGDTFVIWKMDRAFRSLRESLDYLDLFQARHIDFRSLTEPIDTATPIGKAMYQLQNVFAELERKLISERTKAGLAAARQRGKILGRPSLLGPEQIGWARSALDRRAATIDRLAAELGVSTRTLMRALRTRLHSPSSR